MKHTQLSRIWSALVVFKYLFSVIITLFAFQTLHNVRYLMASLLELLLIIGISNVVLAQNKVAGHILHFFALLIYNIQTLVLYFSGSFVRLVMLSNLVFLNDLQGKFGIYLRFIFPMIVVTFIPAKTALIKKTHAAALAAAAILTDFACLASVGISYSPALNLYLLHTEYKNYQDMIREVNSMPSNAEEFYKSQIDNYIRKPETLAQKPNIVVIFIEGLSENIVTDERNIMPNLRSFKEEALHFDNYYNHTFATLRGLIGQLYSGYQLNNFDTNSLFSMQYLLKMQGYQTTFINTEPENTEFINYLESLGFDEVTTDMNLIDTETSYIQDKEAYQLLTDTIESQYSTKIPFFTVIYTFGTHMTFDSPDEQFGNGNNILLNRFYNQDFQFSLFLERFKESELFHDTILIVTTDHATYTDDDFLSAFPNYNRESPELDKIPFYIYHAGIELEAIDVEGRNSLDFAPTVLDYLDISAPNYFLGNSLFAPKNASLSADTFFNESSVMLNSNEAKIQSLTDSEYEWFRDLLINYYSAKDSLNNTSFSVSEEHLQVSLSDDYQTMDITLKGAGNYENVWFPVWSDADGQDDLVWHKAKKEGENWHCTISLLDHSGIGIYYIHAYEGSEAPENLVAVTWINVSKAPVP